MTNGSLMEVESIVEGFCCHLLTFFKIIFFKKIFRDTIRVSNGLKPDQNDLSPNCWQRLSADSKSRRQQGRLNMHIMWMKIISIHVF